MKSALAVVFLACAAAIVGLHFSSSLQGTDFPDFYCAARIVLDGQGSHLYDAALQYRYQTEYAGRVGTLYIHPPFEAVLYLSVAWLPLRHAYLLWSFVNLLFLGIAARTVARAALPAWDWRILPIFALIFVPLLLCLIQGQDSIVLLLLIVLGYAALRRGCNLEGGCWLGLALFKFQITLPIAMVLLLAHSGIRKRVLASGFAMVAVALMGLSAAISGWPVFSVYPKFLTHLSAQRFAGIIPQAMPSFRGLVYTVFHDDQLPWAIAVVGILSALALIGTVNAWKRADPASEAPTTHAPRTFDLAFSLTLLFSLLVSYHLNPHDLTLLLLPISLTLYHTFAKQKSPVNKNKSPAQNRSLSNRSFFNPTIFHWKIVDWITLALLTILFLPPLHLAALQAHLYALVAIPLIMLFAIISLIMRENRTPHIALHIDKG